jgi:hypothetical protein
MNQTRGIFESFPGMSNGQPSSSPFAVVPEPSPPASPFAVVGREDSPFASFDDTSSRPTLEPGKPAKLPDRRPRPMESPFHLADVKEGFVQHPLGYATDPFPAGPPLATQAYATAPPAAQQPAPAPSPFSMETPILGSAPSNYGAWPAPAPSPAPQAPQQQALTPQSELDSRSIRQLELRAIFGVDREMGVEEILQRSRALPGIRHVARVSAQDMAAVDSLRRVLAGLGFGGGNLRLFAGSVPIEFIREGNQMLAVQTDGGFAPGVRETLMIVARELEKMGC